MMKFIAAVLVVLGAAFLSAVAAYDLFDSWLDRLRGQGPLGNSLASFILSPNLRIFLFMIAVILIAWGIRENRRLRQYVDPKKLAEIEGTQWYETAKYDLAESASVSKQAASPQAADKLSDPAGATPDLPPETALEQIQRERDASRFLARALAKGPKGRIVIEVSRSDERALEIAREMHKVLRDGGWQTEWRAVLTPIRETGIVLKVRNPTLSSEANSTLIDAMANIGFKPVLVRQPELQEHEATLVIGSAISVEAPSDKIAILKQLGDFRDEGNDLLQRLSIYRVLVPYEQEFETWRTKVQDYLEQTSQGYATRFRSKNVEYQCPLTASTRTRPLINMFYTCVMRLEEFIREISR